MSLLIKPSSSACNMRCSYCFYADEASKRESEFMGMMTEETLEVVTRKAIERAEGSLTFGFQGGEPTLSGLNFFKKAVEMQKKYGRRDLAIHNAIQTNGLSIDEEWAQFLRDNRFLVGLSLDGTAQLHDAARSDAAGRGTAARVLKTARLLSHYGVEFNTLTVVTGQIARKIRSVYSFFRKNELLYQQYIPCLDPLGEARGQMPFSLTTELYGQFLCDLFDMWFEDVRAGRFIYIRYFENLVGMLAGYAPENCGLAGRCANQYVVEGDGSVYPCDFYVLDEYRLGNLMADDFAQLDERAKQIAFIEDSMAVDEGCRGCRFYPICRGGCRRDRDSGDALLRSYFCPAYKRFFAYALPRLDLLAQRVGRR